MLTNYHTHTDFCDGKNTAEEVVLSAISKGFDAIGFSGHGYTPFDFSYCMTDTEGYLAEIYRLKEKYKKDIQIYAGVEEDAYYPQPRGMFDYILGSCHYYCVGGVYHHVDSNIDCMRNCIAIYQGDAIKMAEDYYHAFCLYLKRYKPDIIGHFDLLTKFDEQEPFFLKNNDYRRIAAKYALEATKCGGIFEVNTGAISRGYRTSPYPHEELLYLLKKEGARIMLSSDSHRADTIDFYFAESRAMLKEIGFTSLVSLYNGVFIDEAI